MGLLDHWICTPKTSQKTFRYYILYINPMAGITLEMLN